MATYYVDGVSGNDGAAGGSGTPWKTLNKANNTAAGGDTIKVRTATYYESLNVKTALTFEADTGHTPTIDGRYTASLFGDSNYTGWTGQPIKSGELPAPTAANKAKGNWVIAGCQTVMVQLTGNGASIKGFRIRNIAGRALSLTASNNRAENLTIDFCYGGPILMDGTAGLLKNCTVTRGSVKYFDPTRGIKPPGSSTPYCGGGPESVQTTVVVKGKNNVIEGCTIAYNCAEGLAFAKGGSGAILRNSTLHTNLHWSLGINGHSNATIDRVTLYWCENLLSEFGKTSMPTLLTMGDETEGSRTQGGPTIVNCLFVGGDTAILVGNGRKAGDTGWPRPFQFLRAYIGYCTFVSTPKSTRVANFGVDYEYKHQNSIWENCIFWKHAQTDRMANAQNGWGTGCTFRHNLSNETLPSALNLTVGNIVTTAQTLRNAAHAFTGVLSLKSTALPDPTNTTFNAENYDLVSSSPAIGRASDRSATNGLTPPTVNADRKGDGRSDSNAGAGRYYDIGQDEYDGTAPPPDPDTVTAGFTRTPASGNKPLAVTFTDTSQVTGSAVINSWAWDFGDGVGTSTSQNPSYTYTAAGTYRTTLTVRDTVRSLVSTISGGTVVVTDPPTGTVTADFTRAPIAGEAPLTVTFTDTSQVTGSAAINSWEWDFRDGSTSTSQNPSHTFTTAGTYQVRLTVRDTALNLTSAITRTVTVSDAPVDAVEASFTQSAESGQAPLAVTFTDTSQVTGSAVINSWAWDFGDGNTSTSQSPSHTYATAGVYTPKLTVTDTALALTDSYTGKPITVTAAPPPAPGEDVVFRQTWTALNTSDGEQSFMISALNGLTPKSARFAATLATADGTAADGEAMGLGWAAAGNQVACAIAATHGVADTNAARLWTDGACLILIDGDGAELVRLEFVEFVANGVKVAVTWTGTPAAYLVGVTLGAGTDYEAWCGTAALGGVGSTADVTGPGFQPDAGRFMATWGSKDTPAADATLAMGMAGRLGGAYALERHYKDVRSDGENYLRLFEGQVLNCRYNAGGRAGILVQDWDAQGFTLKVQTDAVNSTVLALAEKFGDAGCVVGLTASATATGVTSYALDFDPQMVEQLISQATGLGTINDNAKAGTIGIHTLTTGGEYSFEVSGENGSATTNEQSLTDDRLVVVGHTGTVLAAGASTLGTAKWEVNYTTAPGTAMQWPALAVEVGQAGGGGGDYITADFKMEPLTGKVPLTVTFTDLSSATNPITSWEWDFGDGGTSTEQNPVHIYKEDGTWDVSLTVSDGTISNTKTKQGQIRAEPNKKRRIIVGPYLMRPITEDSEVETHRDPEDKNAGRMEGELALGAVRISATGTEPAAGTDELAIWYDPEGDDLKGKRPDGTNGTLSFT